MIGNIVRNNIKEIKLLKFLILFKIKMGMLGYIPEVGGDGIEPPTHGFSVHCSTN